MSHIYLAAETAAMRYQTRDPYKLLEGIGAIIHYRYDFDQKGLKGFATIINRVMYAVINGNLSKGERKVVAGHEAGHLIQHKAEIMLSPAQALKDFNLYDNSGRLEYEANSFLADFLVSDDDVLDVVSNEDGDYFSNANDLCIPPPLFAFKLHSMMRRGIKIRSPVDLQSGFLAKGSMW